jgi:hypothetical protein
MRSLTRCAVVPISLIAALSLASSAGASSTSSATSPKKSEAYLCQVIPRVDRLIVTRDAPGNQFRFTFPTVVTVTSAKLAREVATSACGLPQVTHGVYYCPAEFAVSYKLDFVIRGEKGMGGEYLVANPTGCELVTGLVTARSTASRPGFYRLLGRAMGLQHAGRSTFAGSSSS